MLTPDEQFWLAVVVIMFIVVVAVIVAVHHSDEVLRTQILPDEILPEMPLPPELPPDDQALRDFQECRTIELFTKIEEYRNDFSDPR